VNDVYDLEWAKGVTYREVRHRDEVEGSRYFFESANVELARRQFEEALREGKRLLTEGLVIPAYEQVLKSSHLFNTLDARGAVSVSERALSILKVRDLACGVARTYVESLAGKGASA
jgi:glycyl-tRNA synthetase alpha chain